MRIYFLVLMLLCQHFSLESQNFNPHLDPNSTEILANLTQDSNIDVKFYHLDVEIDIDTPNIIGKIDYKMVSTIDDLTVIHLDLDSTFMIDNFSNQIDSFHFQNNDLTLYLIDSYQQDEWIEFSINYHGIPQKPGGYKGLRYETHGQNEPIIATLSTPFLAHAWWPCKDGPEDKADSVYVDITIKDTLINDIQVVAVSNGVLENVLDLGDKKQFQWRHRYPIVPYYIMAAISNYVLVEDEYSNAQDTFPLQYYTFLERKLQTINGTKSMHEMLDFMTSYFGAYPFKNEKYGMTELGYYGAIENQTNTIINRMSKDYEQVIIHELAHQWFADMITCETWHDGWLNEGFATYCEALFYEYQSQDFEAYQNYIQNKAYYDGGTVSLKDIDNPFKIFKGIIYNKGAWVLHMLRGVMGDEAFFIALKKYASDNRFQYKNATTGDFQSVCEAESGLDLNYFFDQWIYDEYYPEYEYNYDDYLGSLFLTIQQVQNQSFHRDVFEMPMEIQVKFKNGADTIYHLRNTKLAEDFSFFLGDNNAIDTLILDPNQWILKKSKVNHDIPIHVSNDDIIEKTIPIYPNPSSGIFYLPKAITLKCYNIYGVEIFPVWSEKSFDLSAYPDGVYFGYDSESKSISKILKMR